MDRSKKRLTYSEKIHLCKIQTFSCYRWSWHTKKKIALQLLCFKARVLVLVGIELSFFTVAIIGLWFGFVLEAVLVTQECFCYC